MARLADHSAWEKFAQLPNTSLSTRPYVKYVEGVLSHKVIRRQSGVFFWGGANATLRVALAAAKFGKEYVATEDA